jgi:hypothetical protein
MTKVNFNPTNKGWRGKMGELIFRLLPNGTAVVSRAPKKKKKDIFSERQLSHQGRFQRASYYASRASKDNPIYAERAAKMPMITAYNLALSDWFHPPVIHRIECIEGCIRVEASDDVIVKKVLVTILDETGTILETGEAIRSETNWWEFASSIRGKTVVAQAWDLPGNVTKSVVQ